MIAWPPAQLRVEPYRMDASFDIEPHKQLDKMATQQLSPPLPLNTCRAKCARPGLPNSLSDCCARSACARDGSKSWCTARFVVRLD